MADYRVRTEGEDERPSVYIVPDQEGEKIIYKNVRKPNLPSTADIAYCEIRIAELMAELDIQRKRCFDLETQADQYVTYEQTIAQLQERNTVLNDENKQLQLHLRGKVRELESAKMKILELEGKLEALRDLESDLDSFRQLLQIREQEIKDWQEKYSSLEQQQTSNRLLEMTNQDLKNQVANLQNDLNAWKERFQKSEQERKKLSELKKEASVSLREDSYQTQTSQPLQQAQSQILGSAASQSQPENKFKAQFFEQQAAQQELKSNLLEKEHRLALLQNELNKLQDQLLSKNELITQLQQDLQTTDEKENEIQRLTSLLNQGPKIQVQVVEKIVPADTAEADIEKANLQSQLDNANLLNERAQVDIDALKEKIAAQEKVISEIQRELRTIPRYQEQIDSLNLDKRNLENQLSLLRSQLDDALNQVKTQQSKIQQLESLKFNIQMLEQKNTQQAREILDLKKKILELEGRIFALQKVESRLVESEKVNEELRKRLRSQAEQLGELTNQNASLQVQVNILKKLESKISSLSKTIQSLRNQVEETQVDSEKWRAKYNQNSSEIVRLTRLLDVNTQRQQKLNEELKQARQEFKVPQLKVEGVPAISRIAKVTVQDEVKINELKNNNLSLQLQLDSTYRTKGLETQESTRQIDNLSNLLQQKRSECELWKGKYLQAEKLNSNLQNQNERMNDIEMRYNSAKVLLQSMTERNKLLSQETEELKSELFEKELQLNQVENLAKERDRAKERSKLLYQELAVMQEKLPKLIQSNNELQKQVLLAEKAAPPAASDNSALIEKLRQRIGELEGLIDETKDDQINVLQNQISILQKELQKQLDLNQQYVKEIQNIDRLKQDALQELSQLQAKELEAKQLRANYLNKMKEADVLRMENDKTNFEMQSRQHDQDRLAESKSDLENQVERLKTQNHNSTVHINKLLTHLNQLEQKLSNQRHIIEMYPELEDTIANQREQISQLLQELDEIRGERDKLNAQLTQADLECESLQPLKQQVEQQAKTLEQRLNEINLWQQRYQELEAKRQSQYDEWRSKYESTNLKLKSQAQLEETISKLKQELGILENENLRLSNANQDIGKENQKLRGLLDQREIEIKRFQTMEREYKALVDKYEGEIQRSQELSDKLVVLQNLLDQAKRDQERLENKTAMLSSEVERLQVMIKNKNQELESQKIVLLQNQQQIDQIQPVLLENKRLLDELNKQLHDNEDLKQEILNLQKQLGDRNNQIQNDDQYIKQLLGEIDRLNQILRSKEDEISESKIFIRSQESKLKDLEKDDQQWNDQQTEMNKITSQLNQVTEVLEAKLHQIENLEKANSQLQSQLLENQKLDFDHLEQTLQSRDKEIEEWRKRFNKMQGDFEKLYAEKLDLNNNLANTDLEIERWKRKANSNQNEIFLLRGIVDQLNVEIERLNKNCIDLLKENDEWRVKYSTLQEQIPQLVQMQPNPDTLVYQVTPGNSFRIPPEQGGSNGEIRRSVRRSLTINKN